MKFSAILGVWILTFSWGWGEEPTPTDSKGGAAQDALKIGRGLAFEGYAAEEQGAWRVAADKYTEALEKVPDLAWIRLRRGFCLEKLGDRDAARADFEKAISLPIAQNSSEDAINDLQSLISLRSKSGPIESFRDPKAAVVLAAKLVSRERTTAHVLLEAACLAEAQDFLRAQNVLTARIQEVTDGAEKNQLMEALENFRRQSEFGPALEGMELEKEGRFVDAIDRYTLVLDHLPETAWVLVRRAYCLAKTGDSAGAKADLRRAMKVPESQRKPTDRIMLAWVKATCPFREFRDGAGAVSLARKVVADEPLIQNFSILASGYAEMGDYSRAQETLMLALSRNPSKEEARQLQSKLDQFREKRPDVGEWVPRAEAVKGS